jgi:hypothetical protein
MVFRIKIAIVKTGVKLRSLPRELERGRLLVSSGPLQAVQKETINFVVAVKLYSGYVGYIKLKVSCF